MVVSDGLRTQILIDGQCYFTLSISYSLKAAQMRPVRQAPPDVLIFSNERLLSRQRQGNLLAHAHAGPFFILVLVRILSFFLGDVVIRGILMRFRFNLQTLHGSLLFRRHTAGACKKCAKDADLHNNLVFQQHS